MSQDATPDLRLPHDALVDLHLHTRYSDGHWRPADLFDELARGGLRLVSVVDHDQFDHLPEMLALGAARGVAVIPGVEVTSDWRGLGAHLLCYAPLATGFTGDALRSVVDAIREGMLANTRLIYDTLLAQGEPLLAQPGSEVVRAVDVARLLVARGAVVGPSEAQALVEAAGYRQSRAPLTEAVAAAHASGAVCLLAHPGRGEGEIHRYAPAEIEALLAEAPLDGVEVYYPTHTPAQVAEYAALAARRGLLLGAGSDSHGPRQRLPLGVAARQVAPLLARLGVALEG